MPQSSSPSPTIAPTALREPDAARYIDMSPAYLRAKRTRPGRGGAGPAYVRIGRTILYCIADLDAWLSANRMAPGEKREVATPRRAPAPRGKGRRRR